MNYARNVFHKAAEAMLDHRLMGNRIASWARENIILSQKFIVPDAGQMTNGKPFDDFKDTLRLPFPRISLFREVEHFGRRCKQICIAASPDAVVGPAGSRVEDLLAADFWVADVMSDEGSDVWLPTRPIGIKILDGPGVQLIEIPSALDDEIRIYGRDIGHGKESFGALNGIGELMLMLSLKNVSTKAIEPSQKLNKKRARNGKLPLYEYHVLVIDGQEVYARDSDSETDRRIRSHFRRGHIRRLQDGRRVWVRATFVHGSAAGFVDKDYRVKGELQ